METRVCLVVDVESQSVPVVVVNEQRVDAREHLLGDAEHEQHAAGQLGVGGRVLAESLKADQRMFCMHHGPSVLIQHPCASTDLLALVVVDAHELDLGDERLVLRNHEGPEAVDVAFDVVVVVEPNRREHALPLLGDGEGVLDRVGVAVVDPRGKGR